MTDQNQNQNRTTITLVALVGAALVLAIAVSYWLTPGESAVPPKAAETETTATMPESQPDAGRVAPQEAAITPGSAQPEVIAQTPTSWPADPLSRSLKDTEIDGQLRAGSDGHLIVDLQVKDFFDYFLSAVGQVSPEEAIGAIATMARNNLPEPASSEAIALLDGYLEYKHQALELGQMRLDPQRQADPDYQLSMLRQALTDLKALRRNTLPPEAANAFFQLEEAYSEYTLATMEIQRRDDLTPKARQTLVEWERQQLPEIIRDTENELVAQVQQSAERQAAIQEAESPADAGRRLRELGLDGDQTEDVVTYLNERETFKNQYADYQQALEAIDTAGLAPQEREAQREALLARHFNSEQKRTWARLRQLDGPGN